MKKLALQPIGRKTTNKLVGLPCSNPPSLTQAKNISSVATPIGFKLPFESEINSQ